MFVQALKERSGRRAAAQISVAGAERRRPSGNVRECASSRTRAVFLNAIALGRAAYRCSEAGEVLATAATVATAFASRDDGLAGARRPRPRHRRRHIGRQRRDAYLRAALYYGLARSRPLHQPGRRWPESGGRAATRGRARRDARRRRSSRSPTRATCDARWLFRPAGEGPFPLVISTRGGSDGETSTCGCRAGGGDRARVRGARVRRPGQNAMLHEHEIGFRPDWEAVITPSSMGLPCPHRRRADALVGVSQDGYWVRARRLEHRIPPRSPTPACRRSSSWLPTSRAAAQAADRGTRGSTAR